MNHSPTGQFYGLTNKTIHVNGITLTDTEYTQPKVDWHYHENAYFTFILQGNVIEGNKKEVYHCPAGTLLFHHWQDPHYNIKPEGFTRGFHVEIDKHWFDPLLLGGENLEGSVNITNPDVKLLMHQIFRETKIEDGISALSIEALLMEILEKLNRKNEKTATKKPHWVLLIDQILHDQLSENLTLDELAKACNIHPVNLSKGFSRYFHCTLGEYIRKLKVEKALSLMSQNLSLTEISYQCGFYDQSHFIRCFKDLNGINPLQHRKLLLQK
jgi:AraC family transcriptional regulator